MTQEKKRQAAIRRIIAAMKGGRHISLFDSAEFEVSQMHTCICYIRKKINAGLIPGYVMKDAWRWSVNGVRYKSYWFESIDE